MAKYSINDTTLDNIADAIRTKTGDTADLTPLQMPAAILSITCDHDDPGGGSGTGDGSHAGDYNFGNLNYAEITAPTYSGTPGYDVPDLSAYISDFSQIGAMYLGAGNGTYIYLKGVGATERYHPNMRLAFFHPHLNMAGGAAQYVPAFEIGAANNTHFYYLDGTVSAPKIFMHEIDSYGREIDSEMTTPFQFKLIMYYEGGNN